MSFAHRLPHLMGVAAGSVNNLSPINNSIAVVTTTPTTTTTVSQFAIHQSRCVPDCPPGYQRNQINGVCVPCGDDCPRIRMFASVLYLFYVTFQTDFIRLFLTL